VTIDSDTTKQNENLGWKDWKEVARGHSALRSTLSKVALRLNSLLVWWSKLSVAILSMVLLPGVNPLCCSEGGEQSMDGSGTVSAAA